VAENGALVARTPASHVTTGEWQSFELRMRRRRAERCLLRADIALEAGFVDDAREALEEARRLAPGVGGVSALEARIATASSAVTESSPARHSRALPIAVAAALAIAAAIVATVMMRLAVPSSASASPSVPEPLVSRAVPALVSSAPLAQVPPPAAALSPAIDRVATPASFERRVDPSSETEARDAAPVLMPPIAATSSPAISPVPADTIVGATTANAPEPPPAAEVAVPNAVPLPSATTAPEPSPVGTSGADDDDAVRAVLARYASAYDRLDASAVQAVWPNVDAGALEGAFDGLLEQQVSLGACTVDVSGPSARANCAGSTRWTPKVGGGSRTEPRAWTFELSRTDSGWRIDSARVRPR
jgi:hypothetical protein